MPGRDLHDHVARPPVRRVAIAIALLLAFITASVLATWPLAARAPTHLPFTHFVATTDVPLAGWVLAYQTHALVSAPWDYPNANIFAPAKGGLFYGPLGFGSLPLFAPFYLVTGNAVLALDATFILGIALTAWTMALVVLAWTGSIGAATLAGATLVGSAWLARGMVATAPFVSGLFYFPLIAYFAARRTLRLRDSLLLALLIAVQSTVDLVYVAPAVFAPLVLLLALRLLRPATRATAKPLALALALALLAMTPVLAGYMAVRYVNPLLQQQTYWRTSREPMHLALGFLSGPLALPAFLVALVALGAAMFLVRPRAERAAQDRAMWAHGILWLGVGFLISLPAVGTFGGSAFRLPLGWLATWIPALSVFRTPGRLGVAGLIGWALLTGAAFSEIERRLRRRPGMAATWSARALLLALLAGVYVASPHADVLRGAWFKPFPLQEAQRWSPEALAVIRGSQGVMLELPVPSHDAPNPPTHTRAMLRSTDHWRPLLNGHHSYYPRGFPERMELAAFLPDPRALAELRRSANLGLIAVRLEDYQFPSQRRAWLDVAEHPPEGLRVLFLSDTELLLGVTGASAP